MLGIRDTLVRIRIRTSLMDPDPTADPAPFFIDFKDGKKILFFSYGMGPTNPGPLQLVHWQSDALTTSALG